MKFLSQKKFEKVIQRKTLNKKQITIKPSKSINIQNHADVEYWEIITEEAVIYKNDKELKIKKGNIVKFDIFESHFLKNISNDDLVFNAYWYLDEKKLNNFKLNDKKATTIIGLAFPTLNASLHLGHISGGYLNASILNKYKNLNNEKTLLYGGFDETVSHIQRTAKRQKVDYDTLINNSKNNINESFAKLDFNFKYFLDGNAPDNLFNKFLKKILKSDYLFESEVLQTFNEKSNSFVLGSNLSGGCPNCNNTTIAIECEECGFFQDESKIQKPFLSDKPDSELISKKITKSYFKVDNKIIDKLIFHFHNEGSAYSHYIIELINKYIKNGLFNEFVIANSNLKDIDQKNITTPLVRALRHLYIINQSSNKKYIYFCGIDNICSHLFSLIILLSIGIDIKALPIFVINHFYLLENEKFSSSNNNAIWFNDLSKKYHIDLIRFYLAKTSPIYKRKSFEISNFQKEINTLKANLLKIITIVNINYKKLNLNQIEAGQWSRKEIIFYKEINSIFNNSLLNCQNLNIPFYIYNIDNFIKTLGLNLENNIDINLLSRTNVYLQCYALKLFSIIIYPIMNDLAKNISSSLGIKKIKNDNFLSTFKNINLDQIINYIKEKY